MIIATWNANNGRHVDRLAQIRGDFQPDLVALQETVAPPGGTEGEWAGDRATKGLSLESRFPHERVVLPGETSPCIAARLAGSPLGPFNVLAVWAKPRPDYFADLIRTLDFYQDFLAERDAVVLGDFNMSVRVQGKASQFHELDARLREQFRMRSAYHAFTGEPFGQEVSPTLYWQFRPNQPFHCDFVYIPETWVSRLRSVVVPGHSDYDATSDHRPVVCEIV
jgi:endonuclease/exonuclease/phosphatase family metal-dependent hydrolase